MMAANCIKLSYFTSFCIKAKFKCCIAHGTVLRSQSNPANLHQQISLPDSYNQTSNTHKNLQEIKKKNVWGSETTEQRHRLSLHVAAVGRQGCLGFSSVAVTDLLSDLGNVFVP